MDGSVSTLAPVFATHGNWPTFLIVIRDPSLDRPKVEFSGLNHVDGLDAPT